MIRELIAVDQGKPAPAQYTIGANAYTGMGVVVDYVNGTVAFPGSATDADIFVVHKDRQLSDAQSYKMQLSDYDTDFNTVANGAVVKIKKYGAGEVFATDQVETNSVNACVNGGVYLRVGTDGKWAVTANAGVDTSNYKSAKTYVDGSHTLYKIAVVE